MKPAALSGLLLLFLAATAQAQFSLLPQVGFDRSKSSVSVNDQAYFSPAGVKGNLKANLRLNYRFKAGHGPYISVGTAPAPLEFSFANASSLASGFSAAYGSLQPKLEGGYQYSFKGIPLGKSKTTTVQEKKTHCSSYYSSCGTRTQKQKPGMDLRIQPSMGFAYNPGAETEITSGGSSYQYTAGNWKTALVPAVGLELGRGRQRFFTMTVSYTRGLGNLDTKSITTIENTKPVVSSFRSKAPAWGLTLGVPVPLSKSSAASSKRSAPQKSSKPHCGSFRSESRSRCAIRI